MSLTTMLFIHQFEQAKNNFKAVSDGDFLIIAGTVTQYIDEELQKRGLVLEKH